MADRWQEGIFDAELWNRLRPDLTLARHLRLQGWGEPLLHPDLEAMAADGAAAGCQVGVTTNGDLINDRGRWLAKDTVDIVTLSVAGNGEGRTRWRDEARTESVWAAVDLLATARRRRTPRLQISFLLTADNMPELPDVVRDAGRSGADEVFVTHLDCTPTADLLASKAFSDPALTESMRRTFDRADRLARKAKIEFRTPSLVAREMITCPLDPTIMASVAWDGRVGPCVGMTLPVNGKIPRATDEGELLVDPVVFGHLGDASLASILDGEIRRTFILPFLRRGEAERRFRDQATTLGWGSPALARLDEAENERAKALRDHPFPAACAGCHKAWGW